MGARGAPREAVRRTPPQEHLPVGDALHQRRALCVSFGQNVGLFCYTLDGTLLSTKHWDPQPIYLGFGTASSPAVAGGRVYLVHDGEAASYITALDAKTWRELWRTEPLSVGFSNVSRRRAR